ncbi:hypothetical protein QFZ58_002722 [Streptomyces sp. B1I3]|nr:hypothetical protein [Streptomyces sp. B1I3]
MSWLTGCMPLRDYLAFPGRAATFCCYKRFRKPAEHRFDSVPSWLIVEDGSKVRCTAKICLFSLFKDI